MGDRKMNPLRKSILGLTLATAAWALFLFAVWCPIRSVTAIVRGTRFEVIDTIATVGMVAVTAPLILAGLFVIVERLRTRRRSVVANLAPEDPASQLATSSREGRDRTGGDPADSL